jgi:Predicted lipoprotein of unknown function (DUF2380)
VNRTLAGPINTYSTDVNLRCVMDENQRHEFDRQESARQAHADLANREKYCPNCSGVSPTGGNCSSCMAIMAAAERGGLEAYREQTCPRCGTTSPGGLVCSSCLTLTTPADEELLAYLADDNNAGDVGSSGENKGLRVPPDHHIFPQQFRDRFKDLGVEIDLYTVTMYEFQHAVLHSEGWNSDWNMFFEMYKEGRIKPSIDDVMDFGEFMMEKYGFSDAVVHPFKDDGGGLGPYSP